MLDTKNRILRFVLGFFLGLFILMIFFGRRDFSCLNTYLPEGRVLESMSRKTKITSAVALPKSLENLTDTTEFRQFLKQAHIDFNKSNARQKPCGQYFVTQDQYNLTIQNCDDVVKIISIQENK